MLLSALFSPPFSAAALMIRNECKPDKRFCAVGDWKPARAAGASNSFSDFKHSFKKNLFYSGNQRELWCLVRLDGVTLSFFLSIRATPTNHELITSRYPFRLLAVVFGGPEVQKKHKQTNKSET